MTFQAARLYRMKLWKLMTLIFSLRHSARNKITSFSSKFLSLSGLKLMLLPSNGNINQLVSITSQWRSCKNPPDGSSFIGMEQIDHPWWSSGSRIIKSFTINFTSSRMTISKILRDGILLKSLMSKITMIWHGYSHRKVLESSKISTKRRRSPRETKRA